MDDGKDNDLVDRRVEVDGVGKPSQEGPPSLTLDSGVRQGRLKDTGKGPIDFRREDLAEPRALFLVPVTGVE